MAALVVGAVITLPSRTTANRLRGSGSATNRVVTFENWGVPLPLKTMLTAQVPVLTPWLEVIVPALASAIVLPATSMGPRMKTTDPSSWQVIKGLFAGARLVSTDLSVE